MHDCVHPASVVALETGEPFKCTRVEHSFSADHFVGYSGRGETHIEDVDEVFSEGIATGSFEEPPVTQPPQECYTFGW